MSGAICAAGSLAPPSRTTILRGAPSGADAARWRRFVVPLAEPASVFFFAAPSGGFCTATGAVCAVAFSAGAGATGACPAAFAEPAGSGCREAIPAAGKLNQSAIASPQASRITFNRIVSHRCKERKGRRFDDPDSNPTKDKHSRKNRGSVSASPVAVSA
jgi:hypothetical protein